MSTILFNGLFTHPLFAGREGELAKVQNVFNKSVSGGLHRNLKHHDNDCRLEARLIICELVTFLVVVD